MKKYLKILIALALISLSKSNALMAQSTRWVDDILPDNIIDGSLFKLCYKEDQVIQYFNNGKGIEYIGEKRAIDSIFRKNYKPILKKGESGLIRIRFIVNCKGETGRFRIIGMNEGYQQKVFDSRITEQLLMLTKRLSGWKPKEWNSARIDYYQYLIFKIKDGRLIMLLP
jgi:hypothetical protein